MRVRDVLRAFRYAKPLDSLSLLRLNLIAEVAAPEAEERAASDQAGEALLELLLSLIRMHLAQLRGQEVEQTARDPEEEYKLLAEDFRSGNLEREAWGLLHHRYFAKDRMTLSRLAQRLGLVYMTLNRRLDRGHHLLANALREREIEFRKESLAGQDDLGLDLDADRESHERPHLEKKRLPENQTTPSKLEGSPSSSKTATSELTGERRGGEEISPDALKHAARLFSALRADKELDLQALKLDHEEARVLLDQTVRSLPTYALQRIAYWSQDHYQIGTRFVRLTLLTDRGEDAPTERWQAQATAHRDLKQVLAAYPEPIMVLLGSPGSGKSTLLRRLELEAAAQILRKQLSAPVRDTSAQHEGEGSVRQAESGPAKPDVQRDEDLNSASGMAFDFCLYLPLNQYFDAQNANYSPRRWMLDHWASQYPEMASLDSYLVQGRVLLLLDGINEIPHRDFADYSRKVRDWKKFCHELVSYGKDNRVLISCRSLEYSTPLSTPELRVPQVYIEPMSDQQFRDFLSVYQPENADAIWKRIEDAGMQDLLRTAYFARLLVDAVAENGELPRGRTALFTNLVRRLMQREIERGNPRMLQENLLHAVDLQRHASNSAWDSPHELSEHGPLIPSIAALAFEMFSDTGRGGMIRMSLAYDEAIESVSKHLDDPALSEGVLAVGTALGLLNEDRDMDTLSFYHQLMQEYFAARKMSRSMDTELVHAEWKAVNFHPSLEEILETLNPADTLPALPRTGWEEPMQLAVAMSAEPEKDLRALMATNLALAGQAAKQTELRPRLPEDLLGDLRWALVARSRNPEADLRDRIACGLALGELDDPRFERRTGPGGAYILPPLIDIESGRFPIGDDDPVEWSFTGASGVTRDHIPRHLVEIEGFSIGQFPVTNAEWRCFLEAGGYEEERYWDTEDARRWRKGDLAIEGSKWNSLYWWRKFQSDPALFESMIEEGQFLVDEVIDRWRKWIAMEAEAFESLLETYWAAQRETEPAMWQEMQFNRPNQPVGGISWYEARAYCNWLSEQSGIPFRLPTEVEWEAAARGFEGRAYPWGDVWKAQYANTVESRIRRPTPIGVLPLGDTPEQVSDLGGNVYDWTSSLFGNLQDDGNPLDYPHPYDPRDGRENASAPSSLRRIARGGSWSRFRSYGRTVMRLNFFPDNRGVENGLRVVRPSSRS